MTNKYIYTFNSMKPQTWHTATELSVAAASMTAMIMRGMVEVDASKTPRRYMRNENSIYVKIFAALQGHKSEFFVLFKAQQPLGMLCSLSNNNIVDCYGNTYNLNGVTEIQLHNPEKRIVL